MAIAGLLNFFLGVGGYVNLFMTKVNELKI